jgi:ferric-dicitrate binding protein FerR (iron transport regulator)
MEEAKAQRVEGPAETDNTRKRRPSNPKTAYTDRLTETEAACTRLTRKRRQHAKAYTEAEAACTRLTRKRRQHAKAYTETEAACTRLTRKRRQHAQGLQGSAPDGVVELRGQVGTNSEEISVDNHLQMKI